MSPPPFTKNVVERLLVNSGRCCCLCTQFCGNKIEIHHIDPNGGNDEENGIPLCFDCHAEVVSYNNQHPRGRKYRPSELKLHKKRVFKLVKEGKLPELNVRKKQNKAINLKHSKYLLEPLHEFSDPEDIESMKVQIDFFCQRKRERRRFQLLEEHIKTGYYADFYPALQRYQDIIEKYAVSKFNVPIPFDYNMPNHTVVEINKLRNILSENLGRMIEDVYEHSLPLEGTCAKCF